MRVYQCEDSLEGIFTAIYNTYEDNCDRMDTRISINDELFLFAEYIPVETDVEKAIKVINTIKRRFGEEDYKRLCFALVSREPEKAQAVYRTVAKGLSKECRPGHLLDDLADDSVNLVFSLARATNNEYLHLMGFTRFAELQSGILYAKIGPKNDVLAFLMPHFADRFPIENFMIHDEKRNLYGVHPAGKDWYLMRGEDVELAESSLRVSDGELEYQELFKYFCGKIVIEERRNLELQRSMLPLRFREYMAEFK